MRAVAVAVIRRDGGELLVGEGQDVHGGTEHEVPFRAVWTALDGFGADPLYPDGLRELLERHGR